MKYEYKEKPYDETEPKSIEEYAKKLVGHTFKEISEWKIPHSIQEEMESYGKKARKGGLGNLIEEKYFGYKANSDPKPDFPEAGVELKVTPYEKKKNGSLSAGERLVLTMISYEQAVEPDFYKSHLWQKCGLILLIYYLRDKRLADNLDYRIDFAGLFTPPETDLEIILKDYELIIEKLKAGKAHELSESDTMYLGACTKGASAEKSTVPQAYYAPEIKARKRAFCFKTSYMTYVLNNYLFSSKPSEESIVKDPEELKDKSFEQFVVERINKYAGNTDKELCGIFDEEYSGNKAQWSTLSYRMLGIKSNKAEEFVKAQIVVKTIRLEENGGMKESISMPSFEFKELVNEEWEESTLFEYLSETKFLFVVFKKENGEYTLKGSQIWNMPYTDLNGDVFECWKKTKEIVLNGVELKKEFQKNGVVIKNNLPGSTENRIIHVRPHTSKTYYVLENGEQIGSGSVSNSSELPDGRRMTKQCFWFNKSYVLSFLDDGLV